MKREMLDRIVKVMLDGAAINFNRDGHLLSVVMVIDKTGNVHFATPSRSFRGVAEKDAYAQAIGDLCRQKKAVAILHLNEAWTVPPARGREALKWVNTHGSLENYPHQTEVLSAQLETAAGMEIWKAPITRAPGGRPSAGPWAKVVSEGGKAFGRFTNMLSHLKG